MNKLKTLLALVLCALGVTFTAQAGVKKIGKLNGCDVYRIKCAGLFAPSTTTVVVADPNRPGTIEGVVANASGTSVLGSVASPAAAAASAYLHQPDKTTVSVNGNTANASGASANSNAAATGGNGGAGGSGSAGGPPGHVNNPSSNN